MISWVVVELIPVPAWLLLAAVVPVTCTMALVVLSPVLVDVKTLLLLVMVMTLVVGMIVCSTDE